MSVPKFSFDHTANLLISITVISNAIATILVFNTNLSVTYRTMFSVSNVMVTNAMACHVFRNTKFGTPPNPYFRTTLIFT